MGVLESTLCCASSGHFDKTNVANEKICADIEDLLSSCIMDRTRKGDIEKLSALIKTNEETEKYAFDYLLNYVDGDEYKSQNENQPRLIFDNTTLEARLPNFEDKVYTPDPSNRSELIHKMQQAVNNGKKIKAMGSRYAFSDITFTDGLLIDMYNGLNDPKMNINVETLNEYGLKIHKSDRNLHLCQSGASFEMIQETIWPKKDRRTLINSSTNLKYKALRDTVGYHQLSFGGAVSSGAAGEGTPFASESSIGSLANQVLGYSMIICDEHKIVRLVQIEPSIGNGCIHDAREWRKTFPDVELIQNDDIFEAGLVSLGLLGVIYSYYILLQDAHFIEDIRYVVSFDEFKQKEWDLLQKKVRNNEIEAFELLLSAHTTSDPRFNKSQPMLITTYSRTNKIPPKHVNIFNAGLQESPQWFIKTVAVATNWITRTVPELIPLWTQLSIIQSIDRGGFVRPCTELGQISQNVSSVPAKVNGFAFSYNKDKMFNYMEDWIKLMRGFKNNDRNQVAAFPAAFRFSSYESKGLLNMFTGNNEGNTGFFWIENIIPHFEDLATVENVDAILHGVQRLSMNEPYYGNAHCGLMLFLNENENIFKNIDKGKFNKFVKIYHKFNKTKTFSNKFTKESGLDDMSRFILLQ